MLCESCGLRPAEIFREEKFNNKVFMISTCRKCPYLYGSLKKAAKKRYMEEIENEKIY